MTNILPDIPILPSIAPLAPSADAWLCDVWGVLHNGVLSFAPAVDALSRYRRGGGKVVLITNAPRPAAYVGAQLEKLGVPNSAYDRILTSGDLTRGLIAAHAGQPLLHIGPERDLGLFKDLDVQFSKAADAMVAVCSGLYDDEAETPDSYTKLLAELAARSVPMICANPDIKVERGTRIVYCAGAIAQAYERLHSGHVIYAGKPHLPVYERAFAMLEEITGQPVARGRVLAIGDGLNTDIAGAARAGVRAVYIASLVHLDQPLGPGVLAEMFAGKAGAPVAAMAALSW